MFLRALKVCDPEYLDTELQHINLVAKKLCYPESFINMAWMQARKAYYESGNKQPERLFLLEGRSSVFNFETGC